MPKCGTIKLCGSNVASRTGGGGRGGLSDTPNNLNILVGNLKEKTQLERHKLECDGNIKVYSNVREMENKNYLKWLKSAPSLRTLLRQRVIFFRRRMVSG